MIEPQYLRVKARICVSMLIYVFGCIPIAYAKTVAPTSYRITDLGTLGGNDSWTLSNDWHSQLDGHILAPAINDRAEIIGYTQTGNGNVVPFLWKQGRMLPLNVPHSWHIMEIDPKTASSCRLIRIDSRGDIVGYAQKHNDNNVPTVFYFLTDGNDFRLLNNNSKSVAILYGDSLIQGKTGSKYGLSTRKRSVSVLHQVEKSGAQIYSTNNRGQIAGSFEIDDNGEPKRIVAVLWNNGRRVTLGVAKGFQNSIAYRINDKGQAIGVNFYYANADGKHISAEEYSNPARLVHPTYWHSAGFIWTGGRMRQLPSPSGYTLCLPTAINEHGDVVGTVGNDHQKNSRAVLWKQGRVYDLNTLIPASSAWILRDTAGINNRGQIVVTGYSKTKMVKGWETNNGVPIQQPEKHVLLLTPEANSPIN